MRIKIVAAVLDTRQLTLYKETGETVILKQGDPRLRSILDEITPAIAQKGFAEIDLTSPPTGYQEFQKQSGVVRFFKVAREKLAKILTPSTEEAVVGKVPEPAPNLQAAIDEILEHAQPVTDPGFDTENLAEQGNIVEQDGSTSPQVNEVLTTHTVVAHVDGKLIPNMERIESYFARAAKLGTPKGVEVFLKRLASVIDQRTHSVEDLLKFMERGDMTVADDGSVIIYKVLRRKGDHYVDCHTGKVPQKVGSYVCMDIDLVDRVRNNECSNGLHVARRGYIRQFSGDVCVIGKLAPEDVVTVPTYDANKMRVMGYHIVAELSEPLYELLKKNRPITELGEGKLLLGNILAGVHTPVLEEVRITERRGGGVVVTPRNMPVPKPVSPKRVKPAEALENPAKEKGAEPINPKDVAKKVMAISRKDQAQKLYKAYKKNPSKKNLEKLVDFKKQVKLGWDKLGIDVSTLDL